MESTKQGTYFHLEVGFDGISLDTVESIEFAFSQVKNCSNVVKKVTWTNGVDTNLASRGNGNVIRVGFTSAETYKFRANSMFYMDTRIHVQNATDNPKTEIVELMMTPTLFERSENG